MLKKLTVFWWMYSEVDIQVKAALNPHRHQHFLFCSRHVLHELNREPSIRHTAAKHQPTAKVFWLQTLSQWRVRQGSKWALFGCAVSTSNSRPLYFFSLEKKRTLQICFSLGKKMQTACFCLEGFSRSFVFTGEPCKAEKKYICSKKLWAGDL